MELYVKYRKAILVHKVTSSSLKACQVICLENSINVCLKPTKPNQKSLSFWFDVPNDNSFFVFACFTLP